MEKGIVSTIGQKCKRCYSCIRECPANAIKVIDGQAFVIEERCIACGHCVKVCSQNAKKIKSDLLVVESEFLRYNSTYAIVAPSFPASFPTNFYNLPNALKAAGFKQVIETSFGADLISQQYKNVFETIEEKTIISSACPAVYNFIEKYYPELVSNLAEIISPMIATARYLKSKYGSHVKVVFIGPCIAKKSEAVDNEVNNLIDAVLTFAEIKQLFVDFGINIDNSSISQFDEPSSRMGKSYALLGGLLKTSDITNDILAKRTISVEGKSNVESIIKDVSENKIKGKFIDILFCEGCINGPAIDSDLNYYSRRERLIEYVDGTIHKTDKNVWQSEIFNSREIDLKRKFNPFPQRREQPSEKIISEILRRSNKFTKSDELNCGACGYKTCREYAISIAKNLAEDDMCLPNLISNLEETNRKLEEAKDQLYNAEKLASIGQLAAGIAHEINNPLSTIMIYSNLVKNALTKNEKFNTEVEDLNLIIEETQRCSSIVKNLLNFARHGKLNLKRVCPKLIIQKAIELKSINDKMPINIELVDNSNEEWIEADEDQLLQVFLNILNNAGEALIEKEPGKIKVKLETLNHDLITIIEDNGCGIADENMKSLFTPFFTTKKIGKGTGLGLAIAYGIIKMHKGKIQIDSKMNVGTKVRISLPRIPKHSYSLN
ncbi:MAG: 4Fe-4S binding protein [Melioribacteraceae bacterium]|nr:4Fe-4S binding protein [Melioribacteraceae bacterium]MCF8265528.1 4Fe-4S binding protein [Melioribacteraceae bacterium]